MTDQTPPICGADLERWRVGNGLTKVMAADAFGLQLAKWEELIGKDQLSEPVNDPVVAMILQLYTEHPESAPIQKALDIKEFYEFLGLQDNPKDKEAFATLIGRSAPSVYRLLVHDGKPGRPLIRWMEAVKKLQLSPRASLKTMESVVSKVGFRQKMGNVLVDGWKRSKRKVSDE
ncbi:antirestriction protein [Massilia atriviolacea]|uniref:Uncharacterized protein n=1 Tax=Massilia atriviolacea TaxID=2495579 RepID=A0A430HCN8_9BURK|nr:hypothetical protein [Massilia atriviolacea]RSZ55259.1 hypothetical protein EJB06_30510 [Massilia atriviolacea]